MTNEAATLLGSGIVRFFSPSDRRWLERHGTAVTDRELAAMSEADRDVVRAACRTVATPRAVATLKSDAGKAGDLEVVAMCERAAAGEREAIIFCARLITYGNAQC